MEFYAIESLQLNQKTKRRKRAQRMQAEKDIDIVGGGEDSAEEDDYETLKREAVRPPVRRKRSKDTSPILEEDIIDGFAILAFKSYEDLEFAIKLASKRNEKRLSSITELTELMAEDKPEKSQGKSKSDSKSKNLPSDKNHTKPYTNQSAYAHQDAGTSDDSGRASERLTASSVAQRDAESSRDRLSDASSRCSSGKGYICDSEGDDDKASDTGSIVFSNPIPRHNVQGTKKHEDAVNIPLANDSSSKEPVAPVKIETGSPKCVPNTENHKMKVEGGIAEGETSKEADTKVPHKPLDVFSCKSEPSKGFSIPSNPLPSQSHPHQHQHQNDIKPLDVFSSASSNVPPFRPAFSNFSTFTPYSCTTIASSESSSQKTTISSNAEGIADIKEKNMSTNEDSKSESPGALKMKSMSPRISNSPLKERDSTSETNNLSGISQPPGPCLPHPKVISTVSWSQITSHDPLYPKSTAAGPTLPKTVASPVTLSSTMTTTATSSVATTNLSSSPSTAPPSSTSNVSTPTTSAPLSFSAESLFSSNKSKDQTDMLRRELDSRFLDRAGMSQSSANVGPYLRQELHHHQHQHTHLHQHHQQIISPVPPAAPGIFPPSLSQIPKIGGVDSPFYRTSLTMPMYPAYHPTLLHPNIGASTQFVSPTHLTGFMPKKTGRWNAMHVRIAWEIYSHQTKQNPERANHLKTSEMLRPPTSHVHPQTASLIRSHELVQGSYTSSSVLGGRNMFDASLPPSYLGTSSHMTLSPFSRYAPPFGTYNSISPYAREPALSGGAYPGLHDPWRSLQRGYLPPSTPSANWPHKTESSLEISKRENEERERQLREREERERQRREREEKERQKEREREREEKLKKEQQERERKEKEKRDFERREMERERMLQQQRLNESCKPNPMMHDSRPPGSMRNGMENEIRIKEENRKEEEHMARDIRYGAPSTSLLNAPPHSFLAGKHPAHLLPGPHMGRSMMAPGPPMPHFPPPPPSVWSGIDPYRDYHSMAPLRYNPLMEAFRVEEERAKAFAAHSAMHYRPKEPPTFPMLHHRMPTSNPMKPANPSLLPPVGMDGGPKKLEDASPAR